MDLCVSSMDILCSLGKINLRMLMLLLAATLPGLDDATSIFEIILGNQEAICSSLVNPQNTSIIDLEVNYPPVVSERLNYEYTITTPNFPFNYPTNIQCITLIKAPNYDYNIVLELRQMFEVEPSKNCVQDFLEITDGPYGFSKRIGKFCNSEPPPKEIISTGPFLWLRFRSDKTLTLSGFQIAYRFTRNTISDPKINYCFTQTIISPGNSFNLNTSFLLKKLKNFAKSQNNTIIPLECVFDFLVHPGFYNYAYTSVFKKHAKPIPCSSNSLYIYNKNTFDENVFNQKKLNYFKICEENDFSMHLLKHSTRTTIRVIISDLDRMNTISIILTSVKIAKDECPVDYFMCSKLTKLCISKNLLCDGEPNCPERADEKCVGPRLLLPGEERNTTTTIDPLIYKKSKARLDEEAILKKTYKVHAIILGSIASILIISMVLCLLLTIHSKKKDKEINLVNVVNVPLSNQDKPQNKNLFYELLQSSEPSITALSTERLSRKIYNDNQIWSKRPQNDTSSSSAARNNDSSHKLNGGIKYDSTARSTTIHPFKSKVEHKDSSLYKIGKYLSVPNPAKNDTTPQKPIIPIKPRNPIQPFIVASPSDDFQSWSSHSFSKLNSSTNKSTHHIQRASSMGSGLRRRLEEPVNSDEFTKNVEWYCGPVIRDNNVRNNSSEMLNANPAKSSQHVPGCRSLPNFRNVGLQNPVYYTKPIPSDARQTITDSLDCSADDNSSYREDTPTFSVQNHSKKNSSHKYSEYNRNDGDPSTHYGFKYFCAHDPMSSNDFIEYIA